MEYNFINQDLAEKIAKENNVNLDKLMETYNSVMASNFEQDLYDIVKENEGELGEYEEPTIDIPNVAYYVDYLFTDEVAEYKVKGYDLNKVETRHSVVVVFNDNTELGRAINKDIFESETSEEERLKMLDEHLSTAFGFKDEDVVFYYGVNKEPTEASKQEIIDGVRADGEIEIINISEPVLEV